MPGRAEKGCRPAVVWLWAALALSGPPSAGAFDGSNTVLQLSWKHGFQFAGYYAAIEKGYYRDAGFRVRVREIGPFDPITAVQNGEADFGVASAELVLHRASGAPVVSLAPIFQRLPTVLLVRPELGIETPRDLRGRPILVRRPGHRAPVLRILRQAGLPVADVNLVMDGEMRDWIEGRVAACDGYAGAELLDLHRRGIPAGVFRASDDEFPWYGDILFTRQDLVGKNLKRVADFREASLRGWQYALENPGELADIIVMRYAPGIPREQWLAEAEKLRPLISIRSAAVGRQNEDRWRRIAGEMAAMGLLDKDGADRIDYGAFVFDPAAAQQRRLLTRYHAVVLAIFVPALIVAAVGLLRLARNQRQRSAELRTIEARFRSLFDEAPVPILLGSAIRDGAGQVADARVLNLNAAMERLMGQPAEAIIGRTLRRLWPDEFPAGALSADFGDMLRGAGPMTHDWYSVSLQRQLRATIFQIGEDTFAAGIQDVTAQVQLQRLLRAQLRVADAALARAGADEMGKLLEDELRIFEEIDAGGLYIFDAAASAFGLVHYWGVSARFVAAVDSVPGESYAGRLFRKGELIVLNPSPERDAMPDGPRYNEESLRAIATFPLMDGEKCMGVISLASRRLDSFSPGFMELMATLAGQIGVALSRSKAETELRDREENFRRLSENIGDAIVICGSEGRALYANPLAVELTGRPLSELERSSCHDWLTPETARSLEQYFRKTGFQLAVEVEGQVRRPEGPPIPVTIKATTTRWQNQSAVLFSLRDRSLQRKMEAEMARISVEEREKLGRELHDGVAQDIAAAALLLSTAHLGTEEDRAARLAEIRDSIQQSLRRIRKLAQGLDSLDAIEGRLADALRNLAERTAEDFGVSCRCEMDSPPVIEGREVNSHSYYIAREAVMNAVRHGRARQIVLRLRAEPDGGLLLEIENDGERFDPRVRPADGMGLSLMRYRADRIGAALEIRVGAERGVTVALKLPGPLGSPPATGRAA